ncbi:MAG: hypothetical protein ACR2RF_00325 [Geminicoccaceae bacterium]
MVDQYKVVTAGQVLEINRDLNQFTKTNDQDRLNAITVIQGMTDAERTAIMSDFGFNQLEDFDQFLEREEEWPLRDRLDWYDYDDKTVQFTAKDGAWFSPEAVESFCGEETGQEATLSINGVNSDFWRHSTNHQHTIVYRLRGYPKKISRVRFRYGAGESARERLNNMDVHASRGLAAIDNAANILETSINITWPVGAGEAWVEHILASKSPRCRYIKLVIDDTDNANNQVQIREFEVWVETRQPTDRFQGT